MSDIALRFDIDTLSCIEEGLPRLLEIAVEFGVPLSFYVNMGHSFNVVNALRTRRRGSRGARVPKLSPYRKLGPTRLLRTVLLNPRIGANNIGALERALRAGHELGLHGGMDHTEWQHFLPPAIDDHFRERFDTAYRLFLHAFGAPKAFCCPGFRHNRAAYRLLDEYGFTYTSDVTGPGRPGPATLEGERYGFDQVPVGLVAPGTVPLLEHCRASGRTAHDAVRSIEAALEVSGWGVLYGHPCFEGKEGVTMLRDCLSALVGRHEFLTVDEARRRHRLSD